MFFSMLKNNGDVVLEHWVFLTKTVKCQLESQTGAPLRNPSIDA